MEMVVCPLLLAELCAELFGQLAENAAAISAKVNGIENCDAHDAAASFSNALKIGGALASIVAAKPTGGGMYAGKFSLNGANRAIINPQKLTAYALNPAHPIGGNKAAIFQSKLGFNQSNAGSLLSQIRQGVMTNPAIPGKIDSHGVRFTVDIPVVGPTGSGVVRTGWFYAPGSTTPSLATLFVK